MARLKIDYGIDLGTTNSAIARMENGESVIKKTKTQMDTLPSCVYFSKSKKGTSINVGLQAKPKIYSDAIMALNKGEYNSEKFGYIEFKRDMGTDMKYSNSRMTKPFYYPEELSAEVLKELKRIINDEEVKAVVITVPAKFTVTQKTATKEAATLAGFEHCELLQEPIAAAMAYGLSSTQKDARWLVFDFGGGTFDAALLKVEDGIMQVFDTEGNNRLGGKDLDNAVIDNILLPVLNNEYNLTSYYDEEWKMQCLRDGLKPIAEEIRIALSFQDSYDYSSFSSDYDLMTDDEGNDIEVEVTVSQQQLLDAIVTHYQKAINICKELLERNNLTGKDLNSIILVGGPTFSPIVRQMLREQVSPNVDTSVDPMTVVARGAAIYAATIDANIDRSDVPQDIVKLELTYNAATAELVEWVAVKLDKSNSDNVPDKVIVELNRTDGAWHSGRIDVDENGNLFEVNLLEGKSNSFTISAFDDRGNKLPCFPNEITILPTTVPVAPLPFNIGIAVWNEQKEKETFLPIKGLEKNKPVPAIGVYNGLKTMQQLRPGVADDELKIAVYQVDDFKEAEGKLVVLYAYLSDVVVTGEEVASLVPKGTEVDITLKADKSEMMTIEIDFPTLGFSIDKEFKVKKDSIEKAKEFIAEYIEYAQSRIDEFEELDYDMDSYKQRLNGIIEERDKNPETMYVQGLLKKLLREIENLDEKTMWERLEKELRDEFTRLEKANADLGNAETTQIVNQLRAQVDNVIRTKDVSLGEEIKEQVHGLYFHLTLLYQCMGAIKSLNNRFSSIRWKDSARARSLLNQAIEIMNNQPTVEKLHPVTVKVIELLPDDERNGINDPIVSLGI